MAIAAASSLSLGSNAKRSSSHCHSCYSEGVCCSTSHGITSSWIKPTFDNRRVPDFSSISFRCTKPLFGSSQFHWLSTGHDLCPSKVSVAADYSDSLPESSSYISSRGYHPLEELEPSKRIRETNLTSAEIARTTIEANSSALLVFPGMVHCEPHEQTSWAEFQYIIDDFGDIYFEILDEENILRDRGASNPVNALIGMDIPIYENRRTVGDIVFDDDYFEVMDSKMSDNSVDWGMPDTSSWVHPIYFAKCLTKAVNTKHDRKMDHPTNGVSIVGCIRPAFADEESYLRGLFQGENGDDYNMEWEDGGLLSFDSRSDGKKLSSTLYRLEIMRVELFSVYGVQSVISLQDFQDAEADVLVQSTPAIIERLCEKGISCDVALKALCKKKGFHVEGANLIGVDSLGMDVRVFSGVEIRTHRFPFKIRVKSIAAAEKQIMQLLFPRSRRKKLRIVSDGRREQ